MGRCCSTNSSRSIAIRVSWFRTYFGRGRGPSCFDFRRCKSRSKSSIRSDMEVAAAKSLTCWRISSKSNSKLLGMKRAEPFRGTTNTVLHRWQTAVHRVWRSSETFGRRWTMSLCLTERLLLDRTHHWVIFGRRICRGAPKQADGLPVLVVVAQQIKTDFASRVQEIGRSPCQL